MNYRNTWFWVAVAAVLFAFILLFHPTKPKAPSGPAKVLPGLKAAAVTAVEVMPKGKLEIRVDRTNDTWQLTRPLPYPAQSASIDNLLTTLEQLTPATRITEAEVANRFNVDEDYGFANPQFTVRLRQADSVRSLRIGRRTEPGDQVFVQVIGVEGVYVVDAELLKSVPQTANEWRDTTLLNLKGLVIDHLAVTNGTKIFALQRDDPNAPWRMVWPIQARADNAKIEESLRRLQHLRIRQFIDAKADLEALGLQPPDLELALGQGTNALLRLQFGKSPTNDASLVYARCCDQDTLGTVANEALEPWRAPVNEFRDPHLLALTVPVETIVVQGEDTFSVQRQTNNTWRALPQNFPADAGLVQDLLSALTELRVVQFVQDNVTELGLPAYGLAPPRRRYTLNAAPGDPAAATTNTMLAELNFGTNQEDNVFVKRGDESYVYAVKLADFERLPAASWQLRERAIWNFSTNDVARLLISQQGKQRQLIRRGPYEWSLAPGSQGSIDDLGVEETVRGLTQLSAAAWVARGAQNRARFGFSDDGYQLTFELKDGQKAVLEFGGQAPSGFPYAAVTLDGELWIFEFPVRLYWDVLRCLSIPAGL